MMMRQKQYPLTVALLVSLLGVLAGAQDDFVSAAVPDVDGLLGETLRVASAPALLSRCVTSEP